MKLLFSTEGLHPAKCFQRWQEVVQDRVRTIELRRPTDRPFEGKLEMADIGSLQITRTAYSSMHAVNTAASIRKSTRPPGLGVIVRLSGQTVLQQDDREAILKPGDLVVVDRRPTVHVSNGATESLFLDLPRERLESVLGPARLFNALTISADLASTKLATSFLKELARLGSQLSPDAAERMSLIGLDLIIASVAERLARDVPRPLHGNIAVQRAKAYVEAHLCDPKLSPPELAAAVGMSLRRLQELFHERGHHIADWIWERRLAAAAKSLADPGCLHLSIGTLAYGCGFASQAHFSRRFKDRHGLTPREYRAAIALRGNHVLSAPQA